jgi:hypothetical protein
MVPPAMKVFPSIPHTWKKEFGCPPNFPLWPFKEQLGGHPIKDPLCKSHPGSAKLASPQTEYWNRKVPLWPRKDHFPKGWLRAGAVGGEHRGRKCVCEKQPQYNAMDVRHVALWAADKALR